MFSIGNKVRYYAYPSAEPELGIIKSFTPDDNNVFVVYNCDNCWSRYYEFTACSTPITKLRLGWED